MKRIRLTDLLLQDGKHRVYLGNGTYHDFRSKREGLAFLARLSEELTEHMYRLRSVYVSFVQYYHDRWAHFQTYGDRRSYKVTDWMGQQAIRRQLGNVEELLDALPAVERRPDSGQFVFVVLDKVARLCWQALQALEAVAELQRDMTSRWRLGELRDRLTQLDEQRAGLGRRTASGFHTPRIAYVHAGDESPVIYQLLSNGDADAQGKEVVNG